MPIKERPLGTDYDPSENTLDDQPQQQQMQAESAEEQDDDDAEVSAE
jgi:hypothetical protein